MSISVKRAKSYVDFCEDLSLRADWETAVEELDTVRRAPSERIVDVRLRQAAEKVQALEKDMNASTVRIHIEALGRKKWGEIAADHPPRPAHEQDATLGINTATFFDDVAKVSIFAVNEKVSGDVRDFDPKKEWAELADEMTDAQYGEFVDKFLELNRGVVGAPFSRGASQAIQSYDVTSKSQNDSESATSD